MLGPGNSFEKQMRQAGFFVFYFKKKKRKDDAIFYYFFFVLSKPNEAPFLFILSIKMVIF